MKSRMKKFVNKVEKGKGLRYNLFVHLLLPPRSARMAENKSYQGFGRHDQSFITQEKSEVI